MNYQNYKQLYIDNTKTALNIVGHVEATLSTKRPADIKTDFIPEWLWEIICLNIIKLKGVQRKLGGPYTVHPTRMALILLETIDEKQVSYESAAFAAVHDYLQEGDGRSPEAYADALRVFGKNASKCGAMVLLSEPELDYSQFKLPQRLAEYVGYYWQLQTSKKLREAYFNACFMDKIDNGQSWDYVLHKEGWHDERKQSHLITKTVVQLVLVKDYGKYANQTVKELLCENIEENIKKYQISQTIIQEKTIKFRALLSEYESGFKSAILNYHKEMKL